MERKISIIIPIYNVEQYLEECVNSVLEQENFNLLKVLLIDDGSLDDSATIAKRYADEYENIFYYRKENGGLSSARNFGLKFVDTPFVMFLDSDDILTSSAVSSLYSLALETKCPIVIGDLETFPAETPKYLWKKYFGNGNLVVNNIYDFPDLIFGPSACNKLFSVEYLLSNNFSFPEGLTFEDAFAIIPLMLDKNPIAILDETVYLYRKREEKTSIMDSIYVKPANYFNHLIVNEKLYNLIPNNASLLQKELVFKYIIRTYNGFLAAMSGRSQDVLTIEEKTEIFHRLHKMYKNIPLYMFTKYIGNSALKIIYFSLLENNLDLFLEPIVIGNNLKIEDQKINLPLKRTIASTDFTLCNWSIWFDYISVGKKKITFYGLMETPNFALNQELENEILFSLENTTKKKKKKKIKIIGTYIGEIIHRNYQTHEAAKFHGVKFSIPFKDLKSLPKSYSELKVQIRDKTTKELTTRKVNAYGLLNRFKGVIKDSQNNKIAYLNILKDRSIQIRNGIQPLKKLIKAQVNKTINIQKRSFNLGGKIRLLYWLTYPFLSKKEIVLIGERRDTFQDNSSHLFRHVRQKHTRANWYYLIDRNSPQFNEVKKLGNVIKIDSLKHYLYLLNADKLINSYDVESYMIPTGYTKGQYLKKFGDLINYKRIFLQHGIVYNNISSAASRYKTAYDLIVSSNSKETTFFIKDAYFKKEQIIKSGIPRYDRLAKHIRNSPINESNTKQILLMPTWRSTLAKKSYLITSKQQGADDLEFMDSEYYQFYNGILINPEIHRFLEENNAVLNFYPHYEMHDFLHLFKTTNNRINIIKDKKVQDLLIENDVLITDYSSVFFDFAFMQKPIIFTQFDYDYFYKTQYKEGYLNFSDQKIGPVVEKVNGLIKALEQITDQQYKMTNEQIEYCRQFFDYFDGTSISEKIYQRIEQL